MLNSGRGASYWGGRRSPTAKFTGDQVNQIKCDYNNGVTQVNIAKKFNCSVSTVQRIVTGRSYKTLTPQPPKAEGE